MLEHRVCGACARSLICFSGVEEDNVSRRHFRSYVFCGQCQKLYRRESKNHKIVSEMLINSYCPKMIKVKAFLQTPEPILRRDEVKMSFDMAKGLLFSGIYAVLGLYGKDSRAVPSGGKAGLKRKLSKELPRNVCMPCFDVVFARLANKISKNGGWQ